MATLSPKQYMEFMLELEKVSASLGMAMENSEALSNDAMVEDFLKIFKQLKEDVDTTAYAIDETLSALSCGQ